MTEVGMFEGLNPLAFGPGFLRQRHHRGGEVKLYRLGQFWSIDWAEGFIDKPKMREKVSGCLFFCRL